MRSMRSKSYISSENTDKPLYTTILDIFDQRVKEPPNKEALIHRRIDGKRSSKTFQELQRDSSKLARYLIQNGVKKGDRVALSGLNTIEWVVAEFAIFMTGAVLVNVGYTVVDHMTVTNVLQKAKCKFLIFDMWSREKFEDAVSTIFTDLEKYRALNFPEASDVTCSIVLVRPSDRFCYPTLQEIMDMNLPEVEFPDVNPDDHIAIFFNIRERGSIQTIRTHQFFFS